MRIGQTAVLQGSSRRHRPCDLSRDRMPCRRRPRTGARHRHFHHWKFSRQCHTTPKPWQTQDQSRLRVPSRVWQSGPTNPIQMQLGSPKNPHEIAANEKVQPPPAPRRHCTPNQRRRVLHSRGSLWAATTGYRFMSGKSWIPRPESAAAPGGTSPYRSCTGRGWRPK